MLMCVCYKPEWHLNLNRFQEKDIHHKGLFLFKYSRLSSMIPIFLFMTLNQINKILKGKDISVEERYFRCLISNLIQTEGIQSLYNMKKFCNYLLSIGEQEGSEIFLFLKNRRQEFLDNTQDIILRQLLVVE